MGGAKTARARAHDYLPAERLPRMFFNKTYSTTVTNETIWVHGFIPFCSHSAFSFEIQLCNGRRRSVWTNENQYLWKREQATSEKPFSLSRKMDEIRWGRLCFFADDAFLGVGESWKANLRSEKLPCVGSAIHYGHLTLFKSIYSKPWWEIKSDMFRINIGRWVSGFEYSSDLQGWFQIVFMENLLVQLVELLCDR